MQDTLVDNQDTQMAVVVVVVDIDPRILAAAVHTRDYSYWVE